MTNCDHLIVGIEAALPGDQLAAQVGEIEVILQPCLEIVRGEQLHQVISLRRFRKRPQAYDPVLVLANFFAHKRVKKLPFADTLDRLAQFFGFGNERIERLTVIHGGTAMNVEHAVGVWQRQHRFLRRLVGHLALREQAPGHDGPLDTAAGQVRPARAKQRLV